MNARAAWSVLRARDYARARDHHRRHQVRVGPRLRQLILIDEVLTPDSSRFWPVINIAPAQSAVV